MKLYYFPGSCALADHIVLEWIGTAYETERVNRDSIKSPQYLALNPAGTVPLLVDGDLRLTQNIAILSYLADRFPDAQLIGNGSLRGRAEVLRWVSFLSSDVHPAFKPIFAPAHFLPDPAFANAIADTARTQVRSYLRLLDTRLTGREWLADARSIADPYLFVMLRWALRLQIGLDGFAHLQDFLARMSADEHVQRALYEQEGTGTRMRQVSAS